jgi:RNA polymerase I-specific transcription initiation factor RRN7
MSVADLIKTIVRDLWTLRLSKLVHRLESAQPVDSESQACSSAAEGGEDGGRKSVKIVGKSIDSPKLVETIALCYMGVLLLRLPIGLVDIYRWASPPNQWGFVDHDRWIKEEDVLYVRAIRGVPIDMQEKLPGEYHKVLDTTVRPLLVREAEKLSLIIR